MVRQEMSSDLPMDADVTLSKRINTPYITWKSVHDAREERALAAACVDWAWRARAKQAGTDVERYTADVNTRHHSM